MMSSELIPKLLPKYFSRNAYLESSVKYVTLYEVGVRTELCDILNDVLRSCNIGYNFFCELSNFKRLSINTTKLKTIAFDLII